MTTSRVALAAVLGILAALGGCKPATSEQAVVSGARSHSLICAFHGANKDEMGEVLGAPSREATQAVQWIVDQIGMENDFTLYSATFESSPLAYAVIESDGVTRRIVYDVNEFVADNGRLSFSDVAIFAHEIGHHIHSDTSTSRRSSHLQELRADRLSGVMVNRLGGTLKDALAHTNRLDKEGSATHPPRNLRVDAIKEGWWHAERMRLAQDGLCRPQWVGPTFSKDGQTCRVAMTCSDHDGLYNTACKTAGSNEWKWQ